MNLDEIERRRLVVFAHGTDWPTAMARLFEDDVPALLAEVKRLRAALSAIQTLADGPFEGQHEAEAACSEVNRIAQEALSHER